MRTFSAQRPARAGTATTPSTLETSNASQIAANVNARTGLSGSWNAHTASASEIDGDRYWKKLSVVRRNRTAAPEKHISGTMVMRPPATSPRLSSDVAAEVRSAGPHQPAQRQQHERQQHQRFDQHADVRRHGDLFAQQPVHAEAAGQPQRQPWRRAELHQLVADAGGRDQQRAPAERTRPLSAAPRRRARH